jgi:hypothetical protein
MVLAADHTEIGQKSEFFLFELNLKVDPIRLNPEGTQPLN